MLARSQADADKPRRKRMSPGQQEARAGKLEGEAGQAVWL